MRELRSRSAIGEVPKGIVKENTGWREFIDLLFTTFAQTVG